MSTVLKIEESYLKELIDYCSKALVGKVLKRFEVIENRDVIKADTKELIYEEFRQFRDLVIAHNRGINVTQFHFKTRQKPEDKNPTA